MTREIDNLIQTGVLQRSNKMDVEALLNPTKELAALDTTSDVEIYQAVINSAKAQEDALPNGGDDDIDDSDDADPNPCPTCREVHQAVQVFNKYLNYSSDPMPRKQESLKNSFQSKMRPDELKLMTDSKLTDYFTTYS
jgi:hypothetical protein